MPWRFILLACIQEITQSSLWGMAIMAWLELICSPTYKVGITIFQKRMELKNALSQIHSEDPSPETTLANFMPKMSKTLLIFAQPEMLPYSWPNQFKALEALFPFLKDIWKLPMSMWDKLEAFALAMKSRRALEDAEATSRDTKCLESSLILSAWRNKWAMVFQLLELLCLAK